MEGKTENMEVLGKLNLSYSAEQEARRVEETLKRREWFEKNGYKWKNFSYPAGMEINKMDSGEVKYSVEEISKFISAEYIEENYIEVINFLQTEWGRVVNEFRTKLENCSLLLQDEYNVILTRYGTGGSYHPPDTVQLNIRFLNRPKIEVFKTLIHEVIHLAIHDSIIKYQVTQWQKERIVDLTLATFFPDMKRMQPTPADLDVKQIDEIYRLNFPNIIEIIKQVGALK